MTGTLSPATMPLDAPLAGSRGSRVLDAMRGTVRLFWIEFRRCAGYWILPLVLPLVWSMNQGYDNHGVVLWFRMSIVTFQSYVIIGPLTAGLTAFLAGRDRRRRADDLLATAPYGAFRRDLVLLAAGAAWGLIAYALIGAWYLGRAVLWATWGGPDLSWLAVGALAIVVHAALGLLVGRIVRGRFAALVAVALPIALAIGADSYVQIGMVDMGAGFGMGMQREQPLRDLSPFSVSLGYAEDSAFPMVDTYGRDSVIWMIGLLGVALAATALVRSPRAPIGLVGLGGSLVVAAIGAYALLDQGDPNQYVEARVEPFTWACDAASGIQVCLHPAYEARLEDASQTVRTILTPVAGLPGVPARWEQTLPIEEHSYGPPGGVGGIYHLDDFAIVQSVSSELFSSSRETDNHTAAQLVVLTALAEQAGMRDPFPWAYGMPAEIIGTAGPGPEGPDFSKLDAFQPTFDAAVERFMALTPEQQRTWLEANWDALRAGTLTLDDLP